jgi:hypothetical protein
VDPESLVNGRFPFFAFSVNVWHQASCAAAMCVRVCCHRDGDKFAEINFFGGMRLTTNGKTDGELFWFFEMLQFSQTEKLSVDFVPNLRNYTNYINNNV